MAFSAKQKEKEVDRKESEDKEIDKEEQEMVILAE